MKVSLENFKPRLRAGRVIPQGTRFIFETEDPYNQIVLPMALADLILLCSGQFTVRQIVEKIYRKQGAVPFKWVLSALHALHQGGFFENADGLTLSPQLESWVAPKKSRWYLAWRFGQRIEAGSAFPRAYYLVTLGLLVLSLLGLQEFPPSPFKLIEARFQDVDFFTGVLALITTGSLMQTFRYLMCGVQLLLLTGKVFNVSVRLSAWGLHLHVGDESNILRENRLYTAMFHASQILTPWAVVYLGGLIGGAPEQMTMAIMALAIMGWELNPFVNSEGRKLLTHMLMPPDRDVVSWHFDRGVINFMNPELKIRDRYLARVCAVWGSLWLLFAMFVLHESATFFGPDAINHLIIWSPQSWTRLIGVSAWLLLLYAVVQAMVEKVLFSALGPYWMEMKAKYKRMNRNAIDVWSPKSIRVAIEPLPLFSNFDEPILDQIIKESEVQLLKAGTVVIHQDDPARDLYILLDGLVEVSRTQADLTQEWVTELGAVSIFGEAALVDNRPRGATVAAKTDIVVLKIKVGALRQAALVAGTVRHLEDFQNAILVNQFFASSPVFRSLSAESVDFLCSRGTVEYYNLEQTVFEQGAQGSSVFLILRGSVDVFVHGQHIKRLNQGSFFGEIALIANIPRTATVVTREPCVFFEISSDSFWEILVQYMDLGVFIETVSESRLKEDLEIVGSQTKRAGSD